MKDTRSALKLMILFFFLCIIYNVLMIGSGIVFANEPPGESHWEIYSVFQLVGFLGTLPFLGAVYKFIKDSGNMISKHEENVKKAVACFIIGSAVGIAVRHETFMFVFKVINHPLHLFFYTIGSVILVKGIARDQVEKLLYVGGGFHMIALTGLGWYLLNQNGLNLTSVGEIGLSLIILASSVIGFILFMIAYNRVNQNHGGVNVLSSDLFKGKLPD